MSLIKEIVLSDGRLSGNWLFLCPGCKCGHSITASRTQGEGTGPCWGFNFDPECPTITPSILVTGVEPWTDAEDKAFVETGVLPPKREFRCHSFVTAGRIRFLADCTHPLAGQELPLQPL